MTTTQIKRLGSAHVFGSTVSVTNASPNLTDSANGFSFADVGCTVTTANTSGRSIASVTSAGLAVMDGNATLTSGPQACTLTPALVNVTKKAGGYTDKTGPIVAAQPPGRAGMVLHALNVWTNAGGTGTNAARALKVLAAQGLLVQET